MKRAVITGITGQDGAYLSQLLLEKGYAVYGVVRDTSRIDTVRLDTLGVTDQIDLVRANLLDQAAVIRLLRTVQPDEVYNLAAQSSVAQSFEHPLSTLQFNGLSTAHLLEAIRLLDLNARFYQASSSEMFGRVTALPITEETTLHPVSPYGISKATAHWTAINYREAFGLYSCSGILFNHESPLRPARFVTKKIVQAAVEIAAGSRQRLALGNVSVQRDWGWAPAYVECMWRMLQQEHARDYVIATGEPRSLRQFVQTAFAHVGLDADEHVDVDPALYRPADIEVIYGDATRARRELGWQYDISFEDLVARLIQGERELASGSLESSSRGADPAPTRALS